MKKNSTCSEEMIAIVNTEHIGSLLGLAAAGDIIIYFIYLFIFIYLIYNYLTEQVHLQVEDTGHNKTNKYKILKETPKE